MHHSVLPYVASVFDFSDRKGPLFPDDGSVLTPTRKLSSQDVPDNDDGVPIIGTSDGTDTLNDYTAEVLAREQQIIAPPF